MRFEYTLSNYFGVFQLTISLDVTLEWLESVQGGGVKSGAVLHSGSSPGKKGNTGFQF
jgi:hypothetical protein